MNPLITAAIACALLVAATVHAAPPPTTQLAIDRVDLMPDRPQPFKYKDFKAIARGLDKLLFDFEQKGQYLPLIWWDDTRYNVDMRGFGFPSYPGRPVQTKGHEHESITTMGALLGATLAGIDKSKDPGGHNWVQMAQVYWNTTNGEHVVLNNVNGKTGETYWYETFPQILFNCLVDRYPNTPQAEQIMRTAAERWYAAYEALKKQPGGLKFDHTGISLKTLKINDNGRWREPDGASGIAFILFSAYKKFGDEKYLNAAKDLIAYTDARDVNPHYEINHLYGTYLAARLNAEHGTDYDVKKFVDWCFNPSETRTGWGVAVGRWGDYECSGIAAGVNISGGYGFVMNTYVLGGTLVPLVRYDERFAGAVGKWMLCAMNAVRLCYPDELPPDHQSNSGWKSDPPNVIAYEGLIHVGPGGKKPYAQGDAIKGGWGPSDLGVYGSGFVGMFASMINPTDVPEIFQLDLLACDMFRDKAYPSYLYYNPHDAKRDVTVHVGDKPVDVYDTIRNDFVARNVTGSTKVSIDPTGAVVLVLAPAGGKESHDGRKTLVDGVVIDFDNGRAPRPAPKTRAASADKSVPVHADRATISVDGDAKDWASLKSEPMKLDTGGRGTLEVELRFAWDDEHLYVLATETHKGAKSSEAPDAAKYASEPWLFDGVQLFIDVGNGRVATLADFVVQLALNSRGAPNLLSASPGPGTVTSASSGTADAGNRTVEARVPWRMMTHFASNGLDDYARRFGAIAPGLRIGCEPLLVEHSHKSQSYLGGSQYIKPIGRDEHSRDIVLR